MVEDLRSVEMEVEISYVCKRRLHIRSILKLSITRRRESHNQLENLEQDVSLLWALLSSFAIHIPKCGQHTRPATCSLKKKTGILSSSKSENLCIPYLPPIDSPFAFGIKSSQKFILKENRFNFCGISISQTCLTMESFIHSFL